MIPEFPKVPYHRGGTGSHLKDRIYQDRPRKPLKYCPVSGSHVEIRTLTDIDVGTEDTTRKRARGDGRAASRRILLEDERSPSLRDFLLLCAELEAWAEADGEATSTGELTFGVGRTLVITGVEWGWEVPFPKGVWELPTMATLPVGSPSGIV